MNNKCIYLKQKFNKKLECKKDKNRIPFKNCKNCPYKEYKSNNLNSTKLKTRTSKLAKLEKNRFSLFTDNMNKCYFCNKPKDHIHEVIYGKNRINSMKYGITLPLCEEHHRMMHNDISLTKEYRKKGQVLFEETYPDLDFMDIFKEKFL